MARPSKKTDEQRASRLAVRLTPAELKTFNDLVRASGLGRSDYVRQAVLEGRVIVHKTGTADPALIAELNRIGVNLNQLTRTANTVGRVPPDLDRLCRVIEGVVMKAVVQEVVHGPDDHD
jgi:hypothetical protein